MALESLGLLAASVALAATFALTGIQESVPGLGSHSMGGFYSTGVNSSGSLGCLEQD